MRLLIAFFLTGCFMLALSGLVAVALAPVAVLSLTVQLLFPILFLGSLGFLLSTAVRNAYGAAVLVVLAGLAFWIFREPLTTSQWNLFLNPFFIPEDLNETVWENVIFTNRMMLACGAVGSVFWGLLNLQNREAYL
jgi:hypothetical protein